MHTRSTDHVIKQEPGSPDPGPSSFPAEDVPAIPLTPTQASSSTSAQNGVPPPNIALDTSDSAASAARALPTSPGSNTVLNRKFVDAVIKLTHPETVSRPGMSIPF
ncbi:hypothetical protein I302_101590 [Kwoniella bestiolae CBS 10118]|uniref:Uncharacterized protein n=1 Tax=Kwoniella bestiolae CBS 10118 TaxID=1296100 RepID=A0A1B9GCM9_9TREE|nr:hypothetical protein I302_00272 [Kwoniella bestiolae CBS 10118]OCF28783.1 hypothetical protein I302_00272 [Kwoniella bestiolae CBS 10118]